VCVCVCACVCVWCVCGVCVCVCVSVSVRVNLSVRVYNESCYVSHITQISTITGVLSRMGDSFLYVIARDSTPVMETHSCPSSPE